MQNKKLETGTKYFLNLLNEQSQLICILSHEYQINESVKLKPNGMWTKTQENKSSE